MLNSKFKHKIRIVSLKLLQIDAIAMFPDTETEVMFNRSPNSPGIFMFVCNLRPNRRPRNSEEPLRSIVPIVLLYDKQNEYT